MDDQQFDSLIRAMATRLTPRRRFSGALVAVIATGAAGVADAKTKRGKSKKKTGGKKPPPMRPPHMGPPPGPGADDCEDFFNDPVLVSDCKKIRRTCRAPEHLCIHGVDSSGVDDGGVSCCPEDKTCTLFGCVDTNRDPNHCGPSEIQCFHDQSCVRGTCTCDDAKCLPGGECCDEACCGGPNFPDHRCCDGQCLNTGSDRANCGQCGKACGIGQICHLGQCVCNDAACPRGQRCIKNDTYYCVGGEVDPACVCGCGTGYKYCANHYGGACVSENSGVC